MAVFEHKANIANGGTTPAGWTEYLTFGSAIFGSAIEGTGVAFSTTAFDDGRVTGYSAASGAIGSFDGEVLERAGRIDDPNTVTITFTGFAPGQIGTFSTVMLYDPASATRGGKFTMQGVTKFNGGTDAVEQTFNFVADSNGEVSGQWIADSDTGLRCGPTGFIVQWDDTNIDGGSEPAIANIDTDNAVNQYQQNAVISLTDFTETITSVTLNSVTCPIQSQVVGTSVTVDIPGSLDTGSYDLVVSGATETDTLSGVSYTQTHPYTAPYGLVDSNSLFTGIVLTDNSYFRFVSDFSNGTLDKSTAEASNLWGNDINDIYTPDAGFTGDDTASVSLLYDDGTTSSAFTVTVSVSEAGVDVWPFPPDPPSIPVTWDWGGRHPMTQARVRMFKGNS